MIKLENIKIETYFDNCTQENVIEASVHISDTKRINKRAIALGVFDEERLKVEMTRGVMLKIYGDVIDKINIARDTWDKIPCALEDEKKHEALNKVFTDLLNMFDV